MSPSYVRAPEAWKIGKLVYGDGLSLNIAKEMLEAW
jgi:hypothetical protein